MSPDEANTDGAWAEALDAFEARLVLAEAALELADDDSDEGGDGGRGIPAAFEAPSVPGPLPAEYADRARALLARALGIEERLTAAQRRIRAELARLPRLPAAAEAGTTLDLQA